MEDQDTTTQIEGSGNKFKSWEEFEEAARNCQRINAGSFGSGKSGIDDHGVYIDTPIGRKHFEKSGIANGLLLIKPVHP